MASNVVAGDIASVGIESGAASTVSEHGGALAGSEYGVALAMDENSGALAGYASGGASAGSEVGGGVAAVDVVAALAVVGPGSSCWSTMPRPVLGLVGEEQVVNCGALDRPVLLSGTETTGVLDHQIVLRGGHLTKPHLFTDLAVVGDLKFITMSKSSEGLCLYLTGKKPLAHPLKHVHVFDDMQKKMIEFCNAAIAKSMAKIAAARVRGDTSEMDKLVKPTMFKPKQGFGRSHKTRVLNALPEIGRVNMSMDGTEWHPECMIRPGQINVAVHASIDNFIKLFEIVNRRLQAHKTLEDAGVHTPTRKLRRTRSNPHHPKGPPEAREVYIKSKGWVVVTHKDGVTPPKGSRTRGNGAANRRFVKNRPKSLSKRTYGKTRWSLGFGRYEGAGKDEEESSQDIFGGGE